MLRRVAIVHDWLTTMRGGERVLESLCAIFPTADLFTLRCERSRLSTALANRKVTTSFIDKLARTPGAGGRFRALLPLFPLAIESFKFDEYQLVISSSHCVALGALASSQALHIAYVHSPMRYVWEAQPTYEASIPGGSAGRLLFRTVARYLRAWDVKAASRPDVLIANSTYTQARMKRYYQRDATVIEPPIDTHRFSRSVATPPPGNDKAPFLVVSALVPYKRVELAVRAMARRPESLVVVGDGPERDSLRRMAGPNVSFRGWVSDAELDELYASCRALVHPGVDDFGMVMVEALAAGKPVVAGREGGAAGIVRSGETGVLFEAPTAEALSAALDQLVATADRFEPERLRGHARLFNRTAFERRFSEVVETAWNEGRNTAEPRRRGAAAASSRRER